MMVKALDYGLVLGEVFAILGYSKTEQLTLTQLFLSGVISKLSDQPNFESILKRLDDIVKSDSNIPEKTLKEITNDFSNPEFEESFNESFIKYLNEYIDSFYTSLDKKGKEKINILKKELNGS